MSLPNWVCYYFHIMCFIPRPVRETVINHLTLLKRYTAVPDDWIVAIKKEMTSRKMRLDISEFIEEYQLMCPIQESEPKYQTTFKIATFEDRRSSSVKNKEPMIGIGQLQ